MIHFLWKPKDSSSIKEANMRNRFSCILCALGLITGLSTAAPAIPAAAKALSDPEPASQPALVSEIAGETAGDSDNDSQTAADSDNASQNTAVSGYGETETETELDGSAIFETEMAYEIPLGISDGLKMDTPTGEAAGMSEAEREDFVREMCEANSTENFLGRHKDVTVTFSLYDEESSSWENYSCTYCDLTVYYSDDWTPGLEELRMLIYGRDECMSHYMSSMGFVRYLNASGKPFRIPGSTPVLLSENTENELLLSLYHTSDAVYAITQMDPADVSKLGLEAVQEDADGPLFYSCLYVLDPETLEVKLIRITAHGENGQSKDVRHITYSYDHGMTELVKAGYVELIRHMLPSIVWGPAYTRTVKVTLDPGTASEKVYSTDALKGDVVSISLPDGYSLYSDAALTQRWTDNGDYHFDLSLWAAIE